MAEKGLNCPKIFLSPGRVGDGDQRLQLCTWLTHSFKFPIYML